MLFRRPDSVAEKKILHVSNRNGYEQAEAENKRLVVMVKNMCPVLERLQQRKEKQKHSVPKLKSEMTYRKLFQNAEKSKGQKEAQSSLEGCLR